MYHDNEADKEMKVKYYTTASGRSPVKKFIDELPDGAATDFALAIDRLKNGELLEMPLSKPLFDIAKSLYELRLREQGNIYRVVYFIKKKDGIYLIHGFQKKTQKMPEREKRLILKRLKDLSQ